MTTLADELGELDAVATASLIADDQVSAAEVVEAATVRTAAIDAVVGGVAAPLYARARARVAKNLPTGPLGGVPTVVKDIVGIAGAPFRNGSRSWHHNRADSTWNAARQHLGTGLVAVATSTMPEFGLVPTTEPLGEPPTRNPWAPAHSPGGSSGGSAALVASGAVPLGFATDGGGSIRIPAAACGVVGLKPSRGRMVSLGEVDRVPIQHAVHGIVARSVRDVAAYHAAAERLAPSPARLRPIGHVRHPDRRRLRIGVVTSTPTGAPIDRDVVRAVEDTAGVLDDAGHRVVSIPPTTRDVSGDVRDYFAVLAMMVTMMSRDEVGRAYQPDLRDPWTRAMAARGRRVLPRLPAVLSRLRAAAHDDRVAFGGVDAVLSPVTTTPAPLLGHLAPTVPVDVLADRISSWIAFTPLQNISGAPAVAVPSTPARTGLPVGVQIAGLPGDEALLLSLAYEIERAAPWPPVARVGESV